jgi:hypothetical protein
MPAPLLSGNTSLLTASSPPVRRWLGFVIGIEVVILDMLLGCLLERSRNETALRSDGSYKAV